MNDYISREAALEECDWYANEFCECEYAIMPLKGALENLPAADVLPRDEAITMGAELAAMHGSDATSQQLEEAYLKGVEDGMTRRDVRPVVLCRDCVHYEMGVCLKIYDDGSANKDAWQERKPDDYCSYGEDRNVPTKESEEVSAVRCWLTNGAEMRPTSMSGENGEES